MGAEAELFARVKRIAGERERLRSAPAGLHCDDVPESRTNFLWLPLGRGTGRVASELERNGVLVRAFPGEGARIAVGAPTANDLVLRLMRGR